MVLLLTAFYIKMASTPFGIMASDEAKQQWNKAFFPTTTSSGILPIISPVTGGVLTLSNSYIFKTLNNGEVWKQTDTNGYYQVTNTSGAKLLFIEETKGQHVLTDHLVFSKKMAAKWLLDTLGLSLDSSARPLAMTSAENGALFLSVDSSSRTIFRRLHTDSLWLIDTAGLGTTILKHLVVDKKKNVIGSAGNLLYRRVGSQWSMSSGLPPNVPAKSLYSAVLSIDSNNVLYAAFYGFGVYFSKDTGRTWAPTILTSSRFPIDQAPLRISSLHSYGDTTYALTDNYGIFVLTANNQAGVLPEIKKILFDSIDFASTGDTTISILNCGNDILTIAYINSTDASFFASNLTPSPIPPGSNARFKISFRPTHEGIATATLKIISNAKLGFDSIIVSGIAGHDADVLRANCRSKNIAMLSEPGNGLRTFFDQLCTCR